MLLTVRHRWEATKIVTNQHDCMTKRAAASTKFNTDAAEVFRKIVGRSQTISFFGATRQ